MNGDLNQSQSQVPLFDVEAEQSVLGAMMLSADVIAEVEGILTAAAFYRPAHATIFDLIVRRHAAKGPTDAVALVAALTDAGEITRIGGMSYVHDLVHTVPTAANGPYYARTVADRALRREVDEQARKVLRMVQQGHGSAVELLDRAQQVFAGIEPGVAGDDGPVVWGDLVQPAFDEIEKAASHAGQTTGVPTGLIDLDQLLNGLHPGEMIVLAARPGIGKTIAAAGWAQHASWRHKLPSVFFTLEMAKVELVKRLLSAETRVPLHAIKSGNLTDEDWTKLARVAGDTADAPLWIDDTPSLTLADIRNRARRLHRRCGGLSMVVVDYLQLIEAARAEGRYENRQVQVSALSRGLKLLAKELDLPVVVVAQLNRGPEQRADKRPQLSDLRESGAIEQDADVVILLHREDYYDKETPRAGEVDFIVAKNRGGPTDTITAAAQLHLSRFVTMAIPA